MHLTFVGNDSEDFQESKQTNEQKKWNEGNCEFCHMIEKTSLNT